MGCQKAIAQKIVEGGDNQNGLHKQITTHFNYFFDMQHNKHINVSIMENKSRGRHETRKCLATEELNWLDVKDQWPGIKSCIALGSQRTVDNKTTTERRYYISTLSHDAERLNQIIKAHWGV